MKKEKKARVLLTTDQSKADVPGEVVVCSGLGRVTQLLRSLNCHGERGPVTLEITREALEEDFKALLAHIGMAKDDRVVFLERGP